MSIRNVDIYLQVHMALTAQNLKSSPERNQQIISYITLGNINTKETIT